MTGESDTSPHHNPTPEPDAEQGGRRTAAGGVPKIGIWAWSFVGFVAATVIVVAALATVSEIILPLTFAAVLAVMFQPLVENLARHSIKPTLAAGVVVLGLLALMTVVLVATVQGVTEQTDQIGASIDAAIANASDALDVDEEALETARKSVEETGPAIGHGLVTELIEGIDALIGIASGLILGALIMYYLLKDGTRFRQAVVAQFDADAQAGIDDFMGDAGRILRDYGRGRTVMSAIVSVFIGLASLLLGLPLVFTIMVVNFIGGYIPYIGAFLGGGLAVIVALGDGGLDVAAIMLVAVLASNLLLENFVEPKVMGRSLDIHPLVVLVVTALGGIIGGIVGLILAVPFYVIARDAIRRLRPGGFFEEVADRAEPTVQRLLE
jgi:putative heme transporter